MSAEPTELFDYARICTRAAHCPVCSAPNRCRLETGEPYKGSCWCERPTLSGAAVRLLLADLPEPLPPGPASVLRGATQPPFRGLVFEGVQKIRIHSHRIAHRHRDHRAAGGSPVPGRRRRARAEPCDEVWEESAPACDHRTPVCGRSRDDAPGHGSPAQERW